MRKAIATPEVAYAFAWPSTARNRSLNEKLRSGDLKFARMIEAHWDGIEAYCHEENKVPLGFVEGFNNKVRAIQRRAYGFRDEDYLRLKILSCMLPKL
jgi:transposase